VVISFQRTGANSKKGSIDIRMGKEGINSSFKCHQYERGPESKEQSSSITRERTAKSRYL